MGTTVIYNGITMKGGLTLKFEESAIRDPSGTDIWNKTLDIRVLYVLNPRLIVQYVQPESAAMGIFGAVGGDLDAILADVKCKLNTDRQSFTYSIAGASYSAKWDINKQGPDLANGPKVTEFSLQHVSSDTIRIVFGIRIAGLCCASGHAGQTVLNHRWCLVDELDENYRTTPPRSAA